MGRLGGYFMASHEIRYGIVGHLTVFTLPHGLRLGQYGCALHSKVGQPVGRIKSWSFAPLEKGVPQL